MNAPVEWEVVPAESRLSPPEASRARKLLVTGDRGWNDVERVVEVLGMFTHGTVLVHGACRGADVVCAAVGEAMGFNLHAYPADWANHGRAAGPIRNQRMITCEHLDHDPIDLCLAFHNDIVNSRGTADMARRTVRTGIRCILFTSAYELRPVLAGVR